MMFLCKLIKLSASYNSMNEFSEKLLSVCWTHADIRVYSTHGNSQSNIRSKARVATANQISGSKARTATTNQTSGSTAHMATANQTLGLKHAWQTNQSNIRVCNAQGQQPIKNQCLQHAQETANEQPRAGLMPISIQEIYQSNLQLRHANGEIFTSACNHRYRAILPIMMPKF